jgi:hypothetical protein
MAKTEVSKFQGFRVSRFANAPCALGNSRELEDLETLKL